MKLKLTEDPKEWRKAACLSALGLAVFTSLLRWRHMLPSPVWRFILCLLATLAVTAALRPRWFRGYYRVSAKMGFAISQVLGRAVLLLFFFLILTPLALALRLAGQDPLRLRRPKGAATYWTKVRPESSLERLF